MGGSLRDEEQWSLSSNAGDMGSLSPVRVYVGPMLYKNKITEADIGIFFMRELGLWVKEDLLDKQFLQHLI